MCMLAIWVRMHECACLFFEDTQVPIPGECTDEHVLQEMFTFVYLSAFMSTNLWLLIIWEL